jgi:XRE family transcriptional regulator, regulator of sulfur utilization
MASDIARQALELRRDRHMTQADLSRITGVAKSDISRFECGRSAPTTRTVERIARALGARLVLVPNEWPLDDFRISTAARTRAALTDAR